MNDKLAPITGEELSNPHVASSYIGKRVLIETLSGSRVVGTISAIDEVSVTLVGLMTVKIDRRYIGMIGEIG